MVMNNDNGNGNVREKKGDVGIYKGGVWSVIVGGREDGGLHYKGRFSGFACWKEEPFGMVITALLVLLCTM